MGKTNNLIGDDFYERQYALLTVKEESRGKVMTAMRQAVEKLADEWRNDVEPFDFVKAAHYASLHAAVKAI